MSNRLFQALEAEAFLMQQYFDGMESYLGLKDGVHLVVWTDIEDLKDKLRYWLSDTNAGERKAIARQGHQYILERHSFDSRVDQLMDMLYE